MAGLGGLSRADPRIPVIAKDMAWCAGDQLRRHSSCRYRYFMSVPRRCSACPLYEPERAEREMRGEGAPPPIGFEIQLARTPAQGRRRR